MTKQEYFLEIPGVGEVLLEPFKYANGRTGFMYITQERSANLTINPLNKMSDDTIYLKMYDEAEVISRHLLAKTTLFRNIGVYNVGINYATKVMLMD